MHDEQREKDTTRCTPKFLEQLHSAGDLFDLTGRKGLQFRKTGDHSNGVLKGTKRKSVAAREQEGGDECGLSKSRLEQLG